MSRLGYYIAERLVNDVWQSAGVWYFDGKSATRVSSYLPALSFQVDAGESVQAAFERRFSSDPTYFRGRISASPFSPSQYYPRMARPVESQHWSPSSITLPNRQDYINEITVNQGHLRSLIGLLERILLVVHPAPDTLLTYGYEIRNLLILACTECETQWRSVLQANGYQRERYTTSDYVRLERAMKLREYMIGFSQYPSFEPVRPFGTWSVEGKPTQDLPWYHAYNATKHDRVGNLRAGTLNNAMTALGACWIMQISQFGGPLMGDQQDIREYFSLTEKPHWELRNSYISLVNDTHHRRRQAVNYSF